MATRSRRRPTAAERATCRREQLQRLQQATAALLTSEGWRCWLRTRSRFHHYSLRNTLLIALQCPRYYGHLAKGATARARAKFNARAGASSEHSEEQR